MLRGICCTGNEIIMRHGIPIVGNFLQQELAVITGAVEAMIVDVQVYHALTRAPERMFSIRNSFPRLQRPNSLAQSIWNSVKKRHLILPSRLFRRQWKTIAFASRKKVLIPKDKTECMVGFSAEAMVKALGGTLDPLLKAIKSGDIKGIAGVVAMQQSQNQA